MEAAARGWTKRLWIAAISLLLAATRPLHGQFNEPIPLPGTLGDNGPLGDWTMGVDFFNNIHIATVKGEVLTLHTIRGEDLQATEIPTLGRAAVDPDLAFTQLSAFLVYAERALSTEDERNEILLVNKVGHSLSAPRNISSNSVDNRRPQVEADSQGNPLVAWSRKVPGGNYEVVVLAPGNEPVQVGPGDEARLAVDFDGQVHLLYLNEALELVYTVAPESPDPLQFAQPLRIASLQNTPEPFHDLEICGSSDVVIAYREGEDLWLVRPLHGTLGEPQLVAKGEIHDPDFSCSPGGALAFAWEGERDISYRMGGLGFLVSAARALETPQDETRPKISVDPFLNLYLTFEKNDKVYFTTNADTPEASFKASRTEGEVPLRVEFTDLSSGEILRRQWDFGDGNTSTEKNPAHVYETPGIYTVTLMVEGPGGRNLLAGEEEIRVLIK